MVSLVLGGGAAFANCRRRAQEEEEEEEEKWKQREPGEVEQRLLLQGATEFRYGFVGGRSRRGATGPGG